jgi:hypothetical protein
VTLLLMNQSDCPGAPNCAASGTTTPKVVVPLPSQSATTGIQPLLP